MMSADRYDLKSEHFDYPAYFTPMMNGEFLFRDNVGDVLVQQLAALAHDIASRCSAARMALQAGRLI
jgi:hypothetical protein